MKDYTLWLWIGDKTEPVASARSINTARKKACGILKKYGYANTYIEILDDTTDEYSSVGTVTRYPIKNREFIWNPLRYPGKFERYLILADGNIKQI